MKCVTKLVCSTFILKPGKIVLGTRLSEDDYRTGCRNVSQLSTTTVLFRTAFTQTIILNLLMKLLKLVTTGFKPFSVIKNL